MESICCAKCLHSIQTKGEYALALWLELCKTCNVNGNIQLMGLNETKAEVLCESFLSAVSILESMGYISSADISSTEYDVIIKMLGVWNHSDFVLFCISPKEHGHV